MEQAQLHFHAALKDFLTPAARNKALTHHFNRRASVKDVIESHNAPHTEIDLIIVNGHSVNFNYIVQGNDDIHVYPANTTPHAHIFATPLLHLSPEKLARPKFVIDVNLGRLARYLRLLGFDCLYRNDFDDETIAEISCHTQRVVLTRDRKLLQRKIITYGYFVRTNSPKAQVKEVLRQYELHPLLNPLTRCTSCNGHLTQTKKQNILHRLKPLTRKYYDTFLACSDCGQIYWQGSHSTRVQRLIDEFSKE